MSSSSINVFFEPEFSAKKFLRFVFMSFIAVFMCITIYCRARWGLGVTISLTGEVCMHWLKCELLHSRYLYRGCFVFWYKYQYLGTYIVFLFVYMQVHAYSCTFMVPLQQVSSAASLLDFLTKHQQYGRIIVQCNFLSIV